MSLWGDAHAASTNKPKFLPQDESSDYNRADCYATQAGWVMQAGHPSSGNSNTSANPEVLVASGGLAGATDTTGLRAPTVTAMRFVKGTTATTDMTSGDGTQRIRVEVTWDEEVTVAGTPQLVVVNGNQSGAGYGNHTLSYISSGSTANRKLFEATSRGLGNSDVLTVGAADIALNSGTLSDTVRGGTAQAASRVVSHVTQVITVLT